MPQDDQVLPVLPPARNNPPRLLTEGAFSPPQKSTLCNSEQFDFSISVSDPDIADRLRSLWFVDDLAHARAGSLGTTLGPSSTAVRSSPIKSPRSLKADNSALQVPGMHVVEVLVSDGEFVEGEFPAQLTVLPRTYPAPDGGTLSDPSYTDSFIWIVNTKVPELCQ